MASHSANRVNALIEYRQYSTTKMDEKRLLTVDEASCYLGLTKTTLYTWTCRKKIPHVKIGRALRFDKTDLDAWIEPKKIAVPPIQRTAKTAGKIFS